jgi:hypothetical protein
MNKIFWGLILFSFMLSVPPPRQPPKPAFVYDEETFTIKGLPKGLEWPKDKETFRWFLCNNKYEIEVLTRKPYQCL